jgi:hypothetical protein
LAEYRDNLEVNLSGTRRDLFKVRGAYQLRKLAAKPSNPGNAADVKLYFKTNGRLYTLDSNGNEVFLQTVGNIFQGTAGETLAQWDAVYQNSTDGEWYKAQADSDSTVDVYGIVIESGGIASTESGEIAGPGMILGLSGLDAGSLYYLSKTVGGDWTTTPPIEGDWEVPLGLALSATTFLFCPGFTSIQRTEETMTTIIGTAGETLSQFNLVYADTTDSGEYKKAINNQTDAQTFVVGMVIEADGISNEATGTIQLFGKIVNLSWSLTPGGIIYLDATAGAFTQSRPAVETHSIVQVGFAISATEIWFLPSPPANSVPA